MENLPGYFVGPFLSPAGFSFEGTIVPVLLTSLALGPALSVPLRALLA